MSYCTELWCVTLSFISFASYKLSDIIYRSGKDLSPLGTEKFVFCFFVMHILDILPSEHTNTD